MFLDESAACERTGDRKYGWSPRGREAKVHTMFKRSKRWSILPAFTTKGYIAWIIHHGSIKQTIFNDFVRHHVLPLTTPAIDGGPNSVLCLDNASAHKSEELQEMCDNAGITLAFLPPYSCDFNLIETSFAVLKRWMKRHGQRAKDYEDFEEFLQEAVLAQGQRHDPGRLFRVSGIDYLCCNGMCN
jgi:transposase